MTVIVNNEPIDEKMIQAEADRLRPDYYRYMEAHGREESPEKLEERLLDWARENVIEHVLIHQAAMADGDPAPEEDVIRNFEALVESQGGEKVFFETLDNDPKKIDAVKMDVRKRIKTDQFVNKLTRDIPLPKDQDLLKYYEERQSKFVRPEMVRVKHIVIHKEKAPDPDHRKAVLKEALDEIKGGTPFEEVAEKFSDCKGDGGDLGFFPRGEMVPAFENIVFDLKKDQVSGIFETEFGHHIAKLYERTLEKPIAFEEVKERILDELIQVNKTKVLEGFVDQLKEKAVIEYTN